MASRTNYYRKSGRSSYSGNRAKSYRYGYQYGSAAPALYPDERSGEHSRRRSAQEQQRVARSRQKAGRAHSRAGKMSAALITFMVGIIAMMCVALFSYISLQAAVTRSVEEIASYESELTSLKEANDETYNEIVASTNLEEIKDRAMTKLGMSYAEEDQIISYQGDTSDYVHQVQEVSK